jgi:hypothetical protein
LVNPIAGTKERNKRIVLASGAELISGDCVIDNSSPAVSVPSLKLNSSVNVDPVIVIVWPHAGEKTLPPQSKLVPDGMAVNSTQKNPGGKFKGLVGPRYSYLLRLPIVLNVIFIGSPLLWPRPAFTPPDPLVVKHVYPAVQVTRGKAWEMTWPPGFPLILTVGSPPPIEPAWTIAADIATKATRQSVFTNLMSMPPNFSSCFSSAATRAHLVPKYLGLRQYKPFIFNGKTKDFETAPEVYATYFTIKEL